MGSTSDAQELLKQEAKAVRARIDTLIREPEPGARMVRMACVYAGMLTETLIDYDEPDVVMEQTFHRIADLLQAEPSVARLSDVLPSPPRIDNDTELGRQLAQIMAERLPKGLDDVHEIAIALVINDFPAWKEEDLDKTILLRVLVEAVVASLTYEMAAQDFCDFVIEDLVADGYDVGDALLGLAAVAGHYFTLAEAQNGLVAGTEDELASVMVREALLHGTPGTKNWVSLSAANDVENTRLRSYMETIKPETDEFFDLTGLDDQLGRAVAVAKAVGRMVAVVTVEDVGQIHPSIAKSLAKTGMILGARYRAEIAH